MVSYKLDKYDKFFVAFVLVIVTIVSFCNCVFADYVADEFTTINGLRADNDTRRFVAQENRNVYYKKLERNHKYKFDIDTSFHTGGTLFVMLVKCNDVPSANLPYESLLYQTITLENSDEGVSFEYFNYNDDNVYFVFSPVGAVPNFIMDYVTFSSDIIDNNKTAINDLVENVGPQQLWSVFESGVDFIGVVVLIAFGLFLIVLLIKKLSKGKSDF